MKLFGNNELQLREPERERRRERHQRRVPLPSSSSSSSSLHHPVESEKFVGLKSYSHLPENKAAV
jgi:ornithine cyclodeaminase/alanine dehydrogenase-like protein (mu-crystallin family)